MTSIEHKIRNFQNCAFTVYIHLQRMGTKAFKHQRVALNGSYNFRRLMQHMMSHMHCTLLGYCRGYFADFFLSLKASPFRLTAWKIYCI